MTGTASASASSANLGPGFDCLALALDLRAAATATPSDDWRVESDGAPAEEATAFVRSVADVAGIDRPYHVTIASEIPRCSGLGSSAAVATAVLAAMWRAGGTEPSAQDVFEAVRRVEGHGDNAAAAAFGGLVVVLGRSVRRLILHESLIPIVAVPRSALATSEARLALPASVSHDAAARSVARAVFLTEGLRTGDPEAFVRAAGDELHEGFREHLSPVSHELMLAARRNGALHAAWSGAGPSVLAWANEATADAVAEAMAGIVARDGEVVRPGVGTGLA